VILEKTHQMLERFLHGFAGLQDWTQTTKTVRADGPDTYYAFNVGETNAREAAGCR